MMRRLSISNLAWSDTPVESIAPLLREAGMDGVELAPTAVWADAPKVPAKLVRAYADRWRDEGLAVSGIQSLLYGHPELRLFDRACWPSLREHLTRAVELAHELDAHIAVFGSPRNRIRGHIGHEQADAMCEEFFEGLIPALEGSDVVLTLEPNAPAYGADYLTHYGDVVAMSDAIATPWIQPQVDTGCLVMVGEDPAAAITTRTPTHVHVSAPSLLPPPGPVDHEAVRDALEVAGYEGWVVLEMLRTASEQQESAIGAARWLHATYGRRRRTDASR